MHYSVPLTHSPLYPVAGCHSPVKAVKRRACSLSLSHSSTLQRFCNPPPSLHHLNQRCLAPSPVKPSGQKLSCLEVIPASSSVPPRHQGGVKAQRRKSRSRWTSSSVTLIKTPCHDDKPLISVVFVSPTTSALHKCISVWSHGQWSRQMAIRHYPSS